MWIPSLRINSKRSRKNRFIELAFYLRVLIITPTEDSITVDWVPIKSINWIGNLIRIHPLCRISSSLKDYRCPISWTSYTHLYKLPFLIFLCTPAVGEMRGVVQKIVIIIHAILTWKNDWSSWPCCIHFILPSLIIWPTLNQLLYLLTRKTHLVGWYQFLTHCREDPQTEEDCLEEDFKTHDCLT